MKKWIFLVAGILLLACAAAGCVQPTEEEARAQLCQDLEALGLALQNMAALNASSSVGDIRDARDDVQSAMENVRNSAAQLGDVRVDELNQAYSDLDQTVQSLPDDATVPEAIQTIRPEVRAVRDARQNLTAELNCTTQ
ncbi:hypothetical protein FGU65_14980 [Methanoculleus sp. FWC-SCC1]|uniref:Secreted protein n=1 Tax=Methanoculleus frigidifontis TaxID=2584085 RepID=A0ABT8ME85_9EURY|nr:hypothetical protein [Methanoculleus sp. FWC-SCC1]MDN7026165.1 hypothetical protein [Methanoculleus sp. FWC-SCC1]